MYSFACSGLERDPSHKGKNTGLLRKIFGFQKTAEWVNLLPSTLHCLYFSPNVTGMIKWRRLRSAELVAGVGKMGKREGKR
jgi:hypothetical protein